VIAQAVGEFVADTASTTGPAVSGSVMVKLALVTAGNPVPAAVTVILPVLPIAQ
jgi:hypothetical protein